VESSDFTVFERGGKMQVKLKMNVSICIGPDCLKVGYDVVSRVEYSVMKGYESTFGKSQDFKFKVISQVKLHKTDGCLS